MQCDWAHWADNFLLHHLAGSLNPGLHTYSGVAPGQVIGGRRDFFITFPSRDSFPLPFTHQVSSYCLTVGAQESSDSWGASFKDGRTELHQSVSLSLPLLLLSLSTCFLSSATIKRREFSCSHCRQTSSAMAPRTTDKLKHSTQERGWTDASFWMVLLGHIHLY